MPEGLRRLFEFVAKIVIVDIAAVIVILDKNILNERLKGHALPLFAL